MLTMKMYIADAFTNKLFQGNQAAICFVNQWPSEQLMKNITYYGGLPLVVRLISVVMLH